MKDLHQYLLSFLGGMRQSTRDLVQKFPPCCTVRATKPLLVPSPGTTGIVVGYKEGSASSPHGEVLVRGALPSEAKLLLPEPPDDDEQFVVARCDPGDLEVVEEGEVSSAMVSQALSDLGQIH